MGRLAWRTKRHERQINLVKNGQRLFLLEGKTEKKDSDTNYHRYKKINCFNFYGQPGIACEQVTRMTPRYPK